METLTEIFSLVCGQARCFAPGGASLPVCQRCLGLYAAAAFTGLWLLVSGTWRRGLPARRISILHIAAILLAMLGGIDVINLGIHWRVVCGAWTGHVAVLWLVCGARQLWCLYKGGAGGKLVWQTPQKVQSAAAFVIITIAAFLTDSLMWLGWTFWSGVAILGVVCLSSGFLAGLFVLLLLPIRLLRRRPPHCRRWVCIP